MRLFILGRAPGAPQADRARSNRPGETLAPTTVRTTASQQSESWRGVLAALAIGLSVLPSCATAAGDAGPDVFDGSYRLETGEVLTGGYFVEDGQGRYLYLDADHPVVGGLFERTGSDSMRSVIPDGGIEITFLRNEEGVPDGLIWTMEGHAPLRGDRVYPHRSRAVTFASADGSRLSGRLLLPECRGPHPVVVSVHGSGPVNRYGGPYQTYFITQGMAVLAYDKRGYTPEPGAWEEPDLARLAADAAAAVEFAAGQREIDPDRIGLVGSSQAGWVLPRAAVEAPVTRFLILRAGAAARVAETVLHERRQELRQQGLGGLDLDYAMDLRRQIYELALQGAPLAATDALVAPYLEEPWYRAAFGEGPLSRRWSTRWWAWAERNLGVSARTDLEAFAGPVLWFLAQRDENVPLVRTAQVLREAFAASPGEDQTIVVVANARHSFLIDDPDGATRFSDEFFRPMGEWLRTRGLSDRACWAGASQH